MPLTEDPTFKLTWWLEDYNISAALVKNFEACPSTGLIPLHVLGDTKWQIDLCPRTDCDWIACSFARCPNTDEEEDVSFSYSITILKDDGSQSKNLKGAVFNCAPFTAELINIISTQELTTEYLLNGRLRLLIEVQRLEPERPADVTRSFWKEELNQLSNDMRKLLESRYRSDFKLVTDGGFRIKTHAFMLLARWPELAKIIRGDPDKLQITIHRVSVPILTKFVHYLYTGQIPASDLTTELFDFIVEQKSVGRDEFHTPFSDMSISTKHLKDHLAFTWVLNDSTPITDFYRVFPLRNLAGVDLLVEISTDVTVEPKLVVSFSFCGSSSIQWVHLQCSATVVVNGNGMAELSASRLLNTSDVWLLPDFAPLTLLTHVPTRRRVKFEVDLIYRSSVTRVENTVTEFHTGSRDLSDIFLLSNDLYSYFSGPWGDSRSFDVALMTTGGNLYSCGALLGIRSGYFRNRVGRRGSYKALDFRDSNDRTVASILEYLHTGWILVLSPDNAMLISGLAQKLGIHRLVEKCRQCCRILSGSLE